MWSINYFGFLILLQVNLISILITILSCVSKIAKRYLSYLCLLPDNCNRKELHVDHHGDIDVEVSFKTTTTKTITLLLYSATFGGITIGKDMQVSVLSSDNWKEQLLNLKSYIRKYGWYNK